MNGLLEILTARKWMISPEFIHSIREAVEHNLNGHVAFEKDEARITSEFISPDNPDMDLRTERNGWMVFDPKAVKVPFVDVLHVEGPITRNGGACSYGSIDIRNLMLEASGSKYCLGHILIINTPGGSAWAKNDFQQAIDYAHSKNQPVLAFVDGMCCSAGMYLAALCDERYYMHPKNEIGCIGVMAAFYTQKDGSKNEYTNETYHELYDPESFEKNKEIRDIANNDDDKELVEELAKLGKEFRADVKAHCPKATDEHLHGKVFNAVDVKGILMDGQNTLTGCLSRIKSLAMKQGNEASKSLTNQSKSNLNMEKYQNIATACGVDELVVTEEGTHLDLSLCDTLSETLNQAEATKVELGKANETIKSLEQQIADGKAATEQVNNEAIEAFKSDHEKAIADLKAANEKALADAKAEHEQAMAKLQSDFEGAKTALAEAEQKIADRDEQIQALTATPAEEEEVESPATNGTGAEQAHLVVCVPQYDSSKSPSENRRIMEEYERLNQARINSKTSI